LRPLDKALVRDLGAILAPQRVLARPLDRLGRSGDASIYRLIPEAVVRPRDLSEMRALLDYARRHRHPLTFRTAGTSLSGQAVTDSLLVELAPFWNDCRVLDGGRRIVSQPAVVGGHLNRLLAPFGYRIGPDPASIDAAMIGGIVANNAGGMCCGVTENSYRTLEAAVVLLADGTLVDSGRPDSDEALRAARPDLWNGLAELRDALRANAPLARRLRHKFSTKNTTGYSLSAFLDWDRPVDILVHLMVGSEGTLGFLAEVTLRTVPEPKLRATALLCFEQLAEAGAAVAPLAEAGAAALEIMDAASLRSQVGERTHPFPIEPTTAAVLTEFRADDPAELEARIARAGAFLEGVRLLAPAAFTRDAREREGHWRLRKGLFPAVGGMRPGGTAVLIEDVGVPVDRLAEAITDLQGLFARHALGDTILFGHAKDGNLHFVLSQDFSQAETVARYERFMREVAELIVGKYDGALKTEHGCGRNIAPFVETEFGQEAYELMRRVKALFDPEGILNPGVILSDDPELYLKNLKTFPRIAASADGCLECGFCEPRCPSRQLTLSPRQRIVLIREVERLSAAEASDAGALRRALRRDFAYEGLATCVADSMCETSCPVKIDTGKLVKEMRATVQPAWARRLASLAAARMDRVTRLARAGLRAAAWSRSLPGLPILAEWATTALHAAAPSLIPRVGRGLAFPRPAPALPRLGGEPGDGVGRVVYFPSCLSRIVGHLPGESGLSDAVALREVLERAGWVPVYPSDVLRLCCGMPLASKAFPQAAHSAVALTAEALWRASREGADPIVTDASPCAHTLHTELPRVLGERSAHLRVFDFPSFWACEVLPRLASPRKLPGTVVLHPVCGLLRDGGLQDLLAVARAHAEHVVVPASAECCGFAGDRGFLVPELTASATTREAAEVRALEPPPSRHYSTSRTCELGMTRAVGRPYRSIIHLVHEALSS
jgi:D-lactate dehydrogenase